MPDSIHIRNARILTLGEGVRLRRGKEMSELGLIPRGEVLVEGGKISKVGVKVEAPSGARLIDANGRVLMPGFVDCHTHACFSGSCIDEWEEVRKGANRADILKKGGGAAAIMRAVQDPTMKQLAAGLRERLGRMLREGTTTAEVKSGYGLTTAIELKMLRAIVRAGQDWAGTVVPTALLGHTVQGRTDEDAKTAAREMLHEVSQEFPDIAIDAEVDEGGWSVEACVRLFEKAMKHHPLRVHADHHKSLGMVAEAIRLHVRSIDHLEASTKADLIALAASQSCGVILPCTGFHTSGRYAKAGFLIDQGGAVALGTNYNPVSGPIHSMPLTLGLAVRFCGMSPQEAIVAATVNAAVILGLKDRGNIAVGQRADMLLLSYTDERMLAYENGSNPVDEVFCGGAPVLTSPDGPSLSPVKEPVLAH